MNADTNRADGISLDRKDLFNGVRAIAKYASTA
jgi:hypothetical protein